MRFKLFKGNGVLAGYADTIQEAMSSCDKNKGWYFEKKGKLTNQEKIHKVIRLCINKQLEPYGLTYDNIKKGESFEYWEEPEEVEVKYLWFFKKEKVTKRKVLWCSYLTFRNEQEFNDWKNFCIDLFKTELKMSKVKAEKEFKWLNLNYGLKQNYEVKI